MSKTVCITVLYKHSRHYRYHKSKVSPLDIYFMSVIQNIILVEIFTLFHI